jgi:hypothetical protein
VAGATDMNTTLHSVTVIPNTDPAQFWAVGTFSEPPLFHGITRIERWNGFKWMRVSSPSPGTVDNRLLGVTAIGPNNAWAAGYSLGAAGDDKSLILHWDGSQWRQVAAPLVGSSPVLFAVLAVNADNIWVVGADYNTFNRTLAEHWDGHKWAVVPTPNANLDQNELTSICGQPNGNLWSVGSSYAAGVGVTPIIERFKSGQWKLVAGSSGAMAASLNGVTCLANNTAVAVGDVTANDPQGVIEHWTGSSWVLDPSHDPPLTTHILNGVTAVPGSQSIWAVGGNVQEWVRGSWRLVSSPNIGAENGLSGVTLVDAGGQMNVWAAGWVTPAQGRASAVVTRLIGRKWVSHVFPQIGLGGNVLNGIAAVSPTDVWAAGASYGSVDKPLTFHWNGNVWSNVAVPSIGAVGNSLSAVGAASSHDVWAVGFTDRPSTGSLTPLIDQWNGSHWTASAGPSLGANSGSLDAISVASSTDVWAAGSQLTNTARLPLVEHWNGATWKVQKVPDAAGGGDVFLDAISAGSSTDVWAVGSEDTGNSDFGILYHWNGISWTQVTPPSPNTGVQFSALARGGAGKPWAAGGLNYVGDPVIVDHWNGATWHTDTSPLLKSQPGTVNGLVIDHGGHAAFAVGQIQNQFGVPENLIDVWHG